MTEEAILKYSSQFKKLRCAYVKDMGKAPHKPILLLSIIQLISRGAITNNRIFITSDLLLTFKQIWNQLVITDHKRNFSLPFFHLRSEAFWYLVAKPGKEIVTTSSKSIKSFKNLKESIAYAEIDRELFLLLQETPNQLWFEQVILDNYFSTTKNLYSRLDRSYEEENIENQILNEPKEAYQSYIQSLQETLEEDEYEEELFVRGGLFKKTIPKIYSHTCCITGMKIKSSHNLQMIDACHIYSFSLSGDDTVTNGIALSPTMHRAFDRGLLTINSNFLVRVSPSIQEEESRFTLSQFEGKQIILPEKEKYYPSQESLSWHNKEVFLL
ncbi:HNH endonuclease [Salinimicrobium sediminilitoris]|uniref:HNH endonuclease n=1 Tax=Salinimicrobium sediminilitoris TaxID=2876715 RepID=UPI001E4491C5|nr:HNH endonuclease [Salinimicrobium sediminilitoris]MCC8359864.1 HNH endonuclease [Salinimicrobium sediminilitoris]